MLIVPEKALSATARVQQELAGLLDMLQADLNNKLDSTIAGRFVRLSSKLFNEVFDGEEKLSELGDKADVFEEELKQKCKLLQDGCVVTFLPLAYISNLTNVRALSS